MSKNGFRFNMGAFLTAILVVLIAFFSLLKPSFFTIRSMANVLLQASEIGIIASMLSFVLICGSMDLSTGSVVAFSGAIAGLAFKAGTNIWICVVISILVGALCGAFNGLMVVRFKIMPIVVTIGTMTLFRGLVYALTGGYPASGFPREFTQFSRLRFLGLPIPAWIMLTFFILGYYILTKTRLGRYIYAMGNNSETAALSGVPVGKIKFWIMTACGAMCGLAAMFYASRLGSVDATLGDGLESQILAAVLLGGVSINGGKGNILNSLLGVLIIACLRSGINFMQISSLYQMLLIGILLLASVAAEDLKVKERD